MKMYGLSIFADLSVVTHQPIPLWLAGLIVAVAIISAIIFRQR
jgi:hypothetical protein